MLLCGHCDPDPTLNDTNSSALIMGGGVSLVPEPYMQYRGISY